MKRARSPKRGSLFENARKCLQSLDAGHQEVQQQNIQIGMFVDQSEGIRRVARLKRSYFGACLLQ